MQDSRRHLQNDFKIHSQQAALVRAAHQHEKALRGRACAAYHHPPGSAERGQGYTLCTAAMAGLFYEEE